MSIEMGRSYDMTFRPRRTDDLKAPRPMIGEQDHPLRWRSLQILVEPREGALLRALGIRALEAVTGAAERLDLGINTSRK